MLRQTPCRAGNHQARTTALTPGVSGPGLAQEPAREMPAPSFPVPSRFAGEGPLRGEASENRGAPAEVSAKKQPPPDRPAFKILVVDDHAETLFALKETLGGYQILTAASGEEALRSLLKEHVDLILLDVRMAGMDGIATARMIRDRKQTADIPIIFMSAIDKTDRKVFSGYQVGGIDYIFKPCDPAILRAKVGVFVKLFEKTEKLQRSEAELAETNQQLVISNARLDKINGDLQKEIEERKRTQEKITQQAAALKASENRLRDLSARLLAAQENERRVIAQDIHDGLGQILSALKFRTDGVCQQVREKGIEALAKPLQTVTQHIQEAIEEARRIQLDLRPPLLDDLGILHTLSWFCRNFKTIYTQIRVEQQIAIREDEVPTHLKTAIYRITQEAFNNIAKHAQADAVSLSLGKAGGNVELLIRDNGQGFNPGENLAQGRACIGLGITSMRERLEFLGGSLTVESAPGDGTRILASWPLGSRVDIMKDCAAPLDSPKENLAGEMPLFRALLVEDNVTFRQSFKAALQARFPSIAIQEAGDGNGLLQVVHTFRPQVIFMDIQLPGKNGLQLTREVKSAYPNTTIIILTSYNLPEYRDAALKHGAAHFMLKDSLQWAEVDFLVGPVFSTKAPLEQ